MHQRTRVTIITNFFLQRPKLLAERKAAFEEEMNKVTGVLKRKFDEGKLTYEGMKSFILSLYVNLFTHFY